jgi:glycosyltransferase involved in cell wall biosynthesis
MAEASRKLTVIVPCHNNADIIEACLKSAAWADELLVVDAFSTDATCDIARRYTDSVVQHEYVNYAAQNNWAIPRARHEWVLVLDSDGRLTEALAAEIQALMRRGPAQDGYWIRRDNYLFGKRVRFSGWGGDRVLRLFRRDLARLREKRVHAGIEMQNTGELSGRIEHRSVADMRAWVNKINRYSSWKAEDKFQRGSRLPALQLLLRPPARFAKDLLLRLGILDGWRGFLIASMSAGAELIMAAKLLEKTIAHGRRPDTDGSP